MIITIFELRGSSGGVGDGVGESYINGLFIELNVITVKCLNAVIKDEKKKKKKT